MPGYYFRSRKTNSEMKKLTLLLLMAGALLGAQAQHSEHENHEKKTEQTKAKGKEGKEKGGKKDKKKNASTGSYGAAITREGAFDVKALPGRLKGKASEEVKIKGTLVAVCQVKGCWMTADLGNGQTMRIRFKDYAFFVPKDAGGKEFYAQGVASWDTTSVAELKHYAGDAGKKQEEIDKITEPKVELVFLAEGVIIEEKKKN